MDREKGTGGMGGGGEGDIAIATLSGRDTWRLQQAVPVSEIAGISIVSFENPFSFL